MAKLSLLVAVIILCFVIYDFCRKRKERDLELLHAAKIGDYNAVRLLLDKGVDVNTKDLKSSNTVLMYGTHSTNVVNILIEYKANVNLRNKDGETALIQAAKNQQTHSLRLLLEAGANPSITANNGLTALDYTKKVKKAS